MNLFMAAGCAESSVYFTHTAETKVNRWPRAREQAHRRVFTCKHNITSGSGFAVLVCVLATGSQGAERQIELIPWSRNRAINRTLTEAVPVDIRGFRLSKRFYTAAGIYRIYSSLSAFISPPLLTSVLDKRRAV